MTVRLLVGSGTACDGSGFASVFGIGETGVSSGMSCVGSSGMSAVCSGDGFGGSAVPIGFASPFCTKEAPSRAGGFFVILVRVRNSFFWIVRKYVFTYVVAYVRT